MTIVQKSEVPQLPSMINLELGNLLQVIITKKEHKWEVDVHYYFDREGRPDYELHEFPTRRAAKKFVAGIYLAHVNQLVPK